MSNTLPSTAEPRTVAPKRRGEAHDAPPNDPVRHDRQSEAQQFDREPEHQQLSSLAASCDSCADDEAVRRRVDEGRNKQSHGGSLSGLAAVPFEPLGPQFQPDRHGEECAGVHVAAGLVGDPRSLDCTNLRLADDAQ